MQQINLYQPELQPQKVRFPALHMMRLMGVWLLALLAMSVYMWSQTLPLRLQAEQLLTQQSSAEARLEQARGDFPPSVIDNTLVVKLKQRRKVLSHTQEIVVKLQSGAFGSVDGLSPYLAGFARQHVEGTWLTGVRVQSGGAALALEGKTLRPELVPVYLERLTEERVFKGKSFSDLQLETLNDGLDAIGFAVRTPGIMARDES